MSIAGSCLCGKVRFEIEKAVGPFEICHCSRCRKVSGSIGLPMVGVLAQDYRLVSGAEFVQLYMAPLLRRPPRYHTHFCSNCGSPVPPARASGERMEIPAGLFDDDLKLKPDKHIFVECIASWDEITDSLPRFTLRELIRERTK